MTNLATGLYVALALPYLMIPVVITAVILCAWHAIRTNKDTNINL